MHIFHVSKNDPAAYSTISEALAAAKAFFGEACTLQIAAGTYKELIWIDQPYITFEGESAMNTKLTYDLYAFYMMEDGEKRGTFRTPTLFINAEHFTAKDMTIENSAGLGKDVGQALAVYADGDFTTFENCRLLGAQDTLFTGPLPAVAYEKNGFRGPKEFAPRTNTRQYYHNCYICGEVDFIYGCATVLFEDCEICNIESERMPEGFATAGSHPEGQKYGYIFHNCRFTSVPGLPTASCYLGRPWRDYAWTVIMNSEIGAHIAPEGWDDWGKERAHTTAYYREYNNCGPSSDLAKRPDWTGVLTKEEADAMLAGIREELGIG